VVVLGGDLVEIAFGLGAGSRLVAADSTAVWPPETEALPKVGHLRRLSAEGILSLTPDLVIASADAGPPAVLDQLRSAGLAVETGPPGTGFDVVVPKIRFIGTALGLEDEADALAATVEAEMDRVAAALADLPDAPSVVFLISAGRGAPMAAGSATAADAMIRLVHARNAVEGFGGYKPLSAEAAIGLAPEAILLPDHVAPPRARLSRLSPSPASPTRPPGARTGSWSRTA
jgi:iron complex transport system substrate-binding protein